MAKAKKRKGKIKKKKVLLTSLVAIVPIILVVAVLMLPAPRTTFSYDIQLTVGNYTGFNVGTDALYFGTILPGGKVSRYLLIVNDNDVPAETIMYIEGDVSRFVYVERRYLLDPHQNTTAVIEAYVPPGTEYGNYTGKLVIQTGG